MIWAATSKKKEIAFPFVNGNLNAQVQATILEDRLLLFLKTNVVVTVIWLVFSKAMAQLILLFIQRNGFSIIFSLLWIFCEIS